MGGVLTFGLIMKGRLLFEDDGRFYMYRIAMNHWWDAGITTKLFGFGNGSMGYLFPLWQVPSQIPGQRWYDYFFWIHSDWLQIVIEQGIAGIAAYSTLFGFVCAAAADRPWLLASVLGWAAMAVFNFPAHLPAHALCGALLVAISFQKTDRSI